jgi:hypothetical protein
MRYRFLPSWTVLALCAAACGVDDPDVCDPAAQTGCSGGQVCELVAGGEPECFAPVVVRGKVFDLATSAAIAGARVVALDVNGAPVSAVASSNATGNYELAIPSTRMADGAPIAVDLTLRADASGYQTFPSGIRQAIPINTGAATTGEDARVVSSAVTELGLLALPSGSGTGAIQGTVEVPKDHVGVLVVAEASGTGTSAVADRDGSYKIFNLGAGTYAVRAYALGHNYNAAMTELAAGEVKDVDLEANDKVATRVTGKVALVNPGEGKATSVILVVESTFNEAVLRGEMPPGLRAPKPGMLPDVTGDFTIDNVPEGRYVVLAAFENDLLVRDPDTTIGGTQILHQEVVSGPDLAIADSFKITGALQMISPGEAGPQAVSEAPTVSWEDDSSEDGYVVTVFDAFGKVVWTHEEAKHTGSTPAVKYAGPLETGMYYQVRVVSFRDKGGGTTNISQSEDLKGIFFKMP